MPISIRPEAPADHPAIAAVNDRAFGQPHEGRLVAALRERVSSCVSLVAERDGRVVGHVFFSPVRVEGPGDPVDAVALGPMAVDPDHQSQGIGAQLVEAGLEACRRRGDRAVFVLGHPTYYPRFGFMPAAAHGLRCEFPVPDELFFFLELEPAALRGVRGTVRYHPEFAALEDDA
jgi:putative acetyltransferase